LFFLGIAIGLMAKGPVALVLIGIPTFFWALYTRNLFNAFRNLPIFTGTGLMILLVLPWYILAELKTPGFLQYFIIGEHFQRFVVSGWKGDLYGSGHARPLGTIWLFALLAFMPWTFFTIYPIFKYKSIREKISSRKDGWGLYLMLWVLAPMLFFSAAKNIIPPYVLPAIPAASILLVECWTILINSNPYKTPSKFLIKNFFVAACFPILLFTIFWILLSHPQNTISKSSQRWTIEYINKSDVIKESNFGNLYYWRKHYYSTDYYSKGRAITLKTEQQLDDIMPAVRESIKQKGSLWAAEKTGFFSDQRASQVGDIVNISINIKDKAKLKNKTRRTRQNDEDAQPSVISWIA